MNASAYTPLRPLRSRHVALRHISMHLSEWGAPPGDADAPLLVLLHGWMDVGASFQFVADAFSDGFARSRRMVAPDWRGFGLTRQSGQEMALGQRPALANRLKADMFLSIHHDSAQLQFLEKKQTENGEVYEATRPIRGYSLFVSGQNPQFRNSYCLAESLGEEILALGRPPTLHHAEAVEGENRPLLHQRLGIYQYDGLAVLRKTAMPAVLLEAGVLVDRTDEAYVSNPHNQQALVEAVTRALRPWRERLARSLAGQRLTPCEAAAALPEPEIKPEAKPEKPGKKP